MKFEAKKGIFLDALQIAQSAIPNKTTLQILHNFLFKLEGGSLEITATDLDLTIHLKIEVEGHRDGSIVVNAKKFLEVIRELPDLPITCSVDDYVLNIKSSSGFQANMTGFEASEYPAMPADDSAVSFQLTYDKLKFLFEKTAFAASNDYTTRVSLTGTYWGHKDDKLLMVSTDGHRLGKAWVDKGDITLDQGIILPPRALSQVLKTASSDESLVNVEIGQANAKFTCGNIIIYTKLIDGPYPDYEKVIPAELNNTICINREELISVLRRVATMAHSKTRQVKFQFEKKQLLLSARNQDLGADSEECLAVDYSGKTLAVGFNSQYVLEVLRLIHTENVVIKLNSNLGATVFKPEDDGANYFFIVMPLRLLDDE